MPAASRSPPLLEIRDLNISYWTRAGEIPAVIDFSLTVERGESVGLVGESGCGKSTVALAIMQYMGTNGSIKSGSIKLNGTDLRSLDRDALRNLRGSDIAMIYQEPFAALNPALTIGSQLKDIPMFHEGVSEREALDRAATILADCQLPDPQRVLASFPHQLSGGQQQRAVIAMALLSNPSLLLLDEPTTALDVTVEAGIVDLVREIGKKYGAAQIYISHNLGLILEVCDRVAVMYSGEVVEEGTIDELFHHPRHPYTHGLFGCIPLPATDKNSAPLRPIRGQLPLPHERPEGCNFGPRCEHFTAGRCDQGVIPIEPVVASNGSGHRVRCRRFRDLDHGAQVAQVADANPIRLGDTVLEVDAMQKYYEVEDRSLMAWIRGGRVRHVKANESLDFDARRAETVAIVGESGCGKSTFAKVLMGLEVATDGEVRHEGIDIGSVPVRERGAERIRSLQMVFQNPFDTLNPSHTIGWQIGRVIRRFGVEKDRRKVRERVLKLLDTVKLPRDFYLRRPRQLSGGQKQRIGIARAFAGNPSLVIADEPVSSLDVSVAAAVTELLMEIQRENKTTLLFISHDLSVVRYLSDRIVVMYLGQIMERGTTEQVFDPPYHPYTEALLSAIPIADPDVTKRDILLSGNLPSALDPPVGCPFSTRCPRHLGAICDESRPPLQQDGDGHVIACHIPIDELRAVEPVIQMREPEPAPAPAG